MKQNIPSSAGVNFTAKRAILRLRREIDAILHNLHDNQIDHIDALVLLTCLINQYLNLWAAAQNAKKGNRNKRF
jgi:hypothetical protein